MRVLLDENIPHDLIAQFPGHDVVTVQRLGWAGLKNGDLLERGRGMIDAFITMDRELETQHDLTVLPLAWSSSWLTRTECLIFSRSWRDTRSHCANWTGQG